ncbi:hypothetical protein [Mixta gaviniae]|uniref:Bacteriocin n=1 Tax=Mixta gaviniae TaxID=665914 RepID=A0A1X1E1I0_9GAMM|nr:hypothetical protein [Mixta gaviniae]AUX94871.1 hypothetical protein C2E15_18525 [Mixta gaviniae]ORM82808.1 hypothetical protein HA44_06850 [Mixta gaviniae]
MRQLNDKEMEQVAGCGILDEIGTNIGAAIGGVVDKGAALGGITLNASAAAGLLGSGIGKLLSLNLLGAIEDIGNGVVGIVENGLSAIKQLTAPK